MKSRLLVNKPLVRPPKSWRELDSHFKTALNSEWYKIITKLQNEFTIATVLFYKDRNIRFVQLPVTTGSVSSPTGLGSDSLPVKINLMGEDVYLADSMQFFLEYACRINKEGAYYIAPSFRGEKADKRHLCQFYHSEAEIPGDLNDVIQLCQEYLTFLVRHFKTYCGKEIEKAAGTNQHLDKFLEIAHKIPRCTFEEAVKILNNDKKYVDDRGSYRTITSAGEKQLMEKFDNYVWLTHFDHLAVPFYQHFADGNRKKALNADLLMGIGETIGSGQRHLTGEEVTIALKLHDIDPQSYKWYIEMKDIVKMQTAGFGLGVERLFLWLLKQNDIRDMQIFPRFNGCRNPF